MPHGERCGSSTCKAGFARERITPALGVPLAGYFAPRVSTGVLDDLEVKVVLFQGADGPVAGLVLLDLLCISNELLSRIRAALRADGFPAPEGLIVSATHTHTGPYVSELFGQECVRQAYLDEVARCTALAARRALADLSPAELSCGRASRNALAFCRRFFMADGRVVTNPGKRNPAIRAPEGTVEREIRVLAVRREGELAAVLANIANHADTTGGEQISRDWPGHLEARIQELAGRRLPVLALIAPSGNLNHFVVTSDEPQTSVAEARRIGQGYAEIVWGMMPDLIPIGTGRVRTDSARVPLALRLIPEEDLARARRLIEEADHGGLAGKALTSEGLAEGDLASRRLFARQLLEFARKKQGRTQEYQVTALKIGEGLAFVSLPGEPFAEIGIGIRQASPFAMTFAISHANGACGYVPLAECFPRGGYETLPTLGGGVREDSADRLIQGALEALRR